MKTMLLNQKSTETSFSNGVISNHLIRKILGQAVQPATAPHLVPRVFAALRRLEADAFDWKYLGPHRLIVRGNNHARTIPLSPALSAWLAPYAGVTGPVDPAGRAAENFGRAMRRLGIGLSQWDLRENYAWNRLALTNDVRQVWKELGITVETIWRPLRMPNSREAAEEFFNLTPEASGRPDWAAEVAQWRKNLGRS